MSVFSEAELAYLGEPKLGRIGTVDATGAPHVVPVGWSYNPDLDTIEVGGIDFANTRKFANARDNPRVCLVIDDLASVNPWRPRCVQIRGHAEALDAVSPPEGGEPAPIIRIHATKVVSWGL